MHVEAPATVAREAPNRPERLGGFSRWVLRGLAFVALGTAGYLAWVSLWAGVDALFGCSGLAHFDCEHVLTSRWSYWLGVPVSVPAVAVYAAMFAMSLLIGPKSSRRVRHLAWTVLILLAVLASGAALWFVVLLVFVEKHLCLYCVIVHACGLTAAGLILARAPIRPQQMPTTQWLHTLGTPIDALAQSPPRPSNPSTIPAAAAWRSAALAVCALAVLIGGQVLFPPPKVRVEQFEELAVALPVAEHRIESQTPPGPPQPDPIGRTPAIPQTEPTDPKPVDQKSIDSPVGPAPTAADATTPIEEPSALPPKLKHLEEFDQQSVSETTPPVQPGVPAVQRRRVSIMGGRVSLALDEHPLLGSPDADHVAVEMFDYTCRHCRALHLLLETARKRYGKSLALVALPVPMNKRCNKHVQYTHEDHQQACEYARLAMAVWRLDRSKFEGFHQWLFKPVRPPPLPEATERAGKLVGSRPLAKEIAGPVIKQTLEHYTKLSADSSAESIPRLLFGKYAMSFREPTAEDLFELLERYMQLKPVRR